MERTKHITMTMNIKILMRNVTDSQKQAQMQSPMKLFPACHPGNHIEVFVNGKNNIIYLSCSKCDRQIAKLRLKTRMEGHI